MTDLISRLRNAPRFGDVNLNDEAADEIERLTQALKKANDQAEHFEREWYLRGDEIERLRAALTRVTTTYDAYRRRGVVPSPVEYADVIVAIEQARAALKEPA